MKIVKKAIKNTSIMLYAFFVMAAGVHFSGFIQLSEYGLPMMIFCLIGGFDLLRGNIELRHFEQQLFICRAVLKLERLINNAKN